MFNKEFLKSSLYTFITGAIISLAVSLDTNSTFMLSRGMILSVLAVAVRGGIKALAQYYIAKKD